jgi:hypothetical protein
VSQKERIKGFEGVGLIGTKHTHGKEYEHILRPKASGTTKVVEPFEKANVVLGKVHEFHEKDKGVDSPHNLEVDDIKKSNGKFGKGKKMVGRNERNK